jgi:Dolichyl-phosphate-mannose-protein mannosyltransferase
MAQQNNTSPSKVASVIDNADFKQMSLPQDNNYVLGKLTWFHISMIITTIIMLLMSFKNGITGDDIVVNEYGKEILKFITGFGSYDYNYEHPLPKAFDRDLVIQYYGGLFSVICVLVNKISPFAEYTTIHFLNALSGALATFFAAKICKRYISESAAVICVWLMFLSPFWLGNAMNNPKDTPFAATYIIAIYLIFIHIENLNKPNWKQYIWITIAIACSINVRVGGILLIPYLFAFTIGANIWEKWIMKLPTSLFRGLLPAVGISIAAYLGCSLLWPNAWHDPINHPLNSLTALTHIPVALNQLWEGTKQMSAISDPENDGMFVSNLGAHYLPKAIAITTPLLIVGGFILSFIMLALHKSKGNLRYAFLLMILFSAIFPVAYIIYKKSNLYHLWRHVLFVYPSICILAAFAFTALQFYFNNKIIKYAITGIIVLGLAEPAYFIAKSFPNTMSYFNSLVGGTTGAYGNYEVDFYYNSVKESSEWFKKNVVSKKNATDTVRLGTNAPHIVMEYFRDDPRVKISYVKFYTRNNTACDYQMFHITMITEEAVKTGSWLQDNVVYKAEVCGKTMNAIFKKTSNDDVTGSALLDKGDISGVPLLLNYLKTEPHNDLILSKLANYYISAQKPDSADAFLKPLLAMDSTGLETQSLQAKYYVQKGQPQLAIQKLQNILTAQPSYMPAYLDLGAAQVAMGKVQEGLNSMNTAAQDPRAAPQAYYMMSQVYAKLGNTQEAQKFMAASQQAQQRAR